MPSLRTSVPDADLQRQGGFDWSYFLKLTIGGAYGTYRYTDLARGAVDSFTGNVDGTSQTWTWRSLNCPGFNQDNAGIESVQFIEVDNLDYVLGIVGGDVGLLGVPYELWIAWFATDGVTIDGTYQASTGLIDDVTYGPTARLTLKANNTYWSRRVLGPPLGPLCPYYFKDVDTCQYAGVDTSCLKTRADCAGRTGGSNTAHFGGFDLALAPNTIIYWQTMQIVAGGGAITGTTPGPAPPKDPPPPPPTNNPNHHNRRSLPTVSIPETPKGVSS